MYNYFLSIEKIINKRALEYKNIDVSGRRKNNECFYNRPFKIFLYNIYEIHSMNL